jgi:hypothetical protein
MPATTDSQFNNRLRANQLSAKPIAKTSTDNSTAFDL